MFSSRIQTWHFGLALSVFMALILFLQMEYDSKQLRVSVQEANNRIHSNLDHLGKNIEKLLTVGKHGGPYCPVDQFTAHKIGKKKLTCEWDRKFNISWYQCPVCGQYFVWPYLSTKNLTDIYSTSYSAQWVAERTLKASQSQLTWIEGTNKLQNKTNLVVLEQGCGLGAFLDKFSSISSRLICMEPDPDMKQDLLILGADKLELHKTITINDEIVADRTVDIWLGSHVMEHAPDPDQFVAVASQKIKLGGLFFQEFPYKQTHQEVLTNSVRNYHLNFFNPKSLYLLLTKHGFCHVATAYIDEVKKKRGNDDWEPNLSDDFVSGPLAQNVEFKVGSLRILYEKCQQRN